MKKGDRIVTITDVNADPLSSPNSIMVAALLTLGIPLHPEHGIREFREVVDGKPVRTIMWTLQPQSIGGDYDTVEAISNWQNAIWLEANPNHPLTFIKRAFDNHTRMVSHIKTSVPLAMVRRGKKVALIPMNASPTEKKRLLDLLNK